MILFFVFFHGKVASSIEEMYRQCRELKETHQCHGVTGRVDHAYRLVVVVFF